MDYQLISNIVRVYPNMLKIVIYHNDFLLPKKSQKDRTNTKSKDNHNRERSIRRTRQLISDIIACNRFDLWCTFTFDCKKCPVKCDNKPCSCPRDLCRRFDVDFCKFRMQSWLHKQKLRNPSFAYIIVPEFHKNGALHFHAFVKDSVAALIPTGRVQSGKPVMKFLNCNLGINHVIDISDGNDNDHNSIAQYMQKYIKKDMPVFRGKKRYFCSQDLIRPESVVNGVSSMGLWDVIKHHKPVYVNDMLEIQEHPIVGLDTATHSKQSSFSAVSSVPVALPASNRRRVLVEPSH